MLWGPAVSVVVVNVATPPTPTAAVPSVFVPSRNVTVPVGVPVAALTVAVNVTASPAAEGFAEEIRFVVVAASAAGMTNNCTLCIGALNVKLLAEKVTSV